MSENYPDVITTRDAAKVVDATLLADTNIYADGDVLSDTISIGEIARSNGGVVVLDSVQVLDEDDQGVALDLIFLDSFVPLGTFNAAPAITDANSRQIVGKVSVAAADYVDLGGARVATKTGIGLMMSAAAASKQLYLATITRGGTPTYTAAGVKLKLGFSVR